jgi:glutamate-1-semialdehyde 2,1-aminomutase
MSTIGPLSKELFHNAQHLMPGGVSSPVRSFASVGGQPFFVEHGKGCTITDADGQTYIDYVMSYGPLIMGHAHPEVLEKVQKVMVRGTSFGAPTGFEIELAKIITDRVASVEMVRFVNSGTEAAMSALRLARGYTGRNKVIKFHGNYHGHADSFLVEAGSGVATLGIPGSPGVPETVTQNTISVPYNDLNAVQKVIEQQPKEIAAICVEPVSGNMGVVEPAEGFLQGLRSLCDEYGIVLLMDEVMTGFRLSRGGAQHLYDVKADVTCFGKIIGGGLPVGAYGGKREIMQQIAPVGPIYQAGTLSGNPLCMAAGIKTLKLLDTDGLYQTLDYRTQYLADEMRKIAQHHDVPVTINQIGSMMTVFFTTGPVTNFDQAKASDTKRYSKFFHGMLAQGIFIPPSAFETWFLSTAHEQEHLEQTCKAFDTVLSSF